jgi:DNA primase
MPLPSSFIDQVRSATEILDVVSQYVPLKPAGKNHKGLCPFHKEKTPSFNVSPERQIFHCFGCGEGGDVFKFLMLYDKMSFMEAVEYLANRAGLTMPRSKEGRAERDDRSLFLKLHEESTRFYRDQLLEKPSGRRALEYFLKRGLSRKTIEERHLGYAPDSWSSLLEHLTRKGHKADEIARSGLAVPRRDGRGYYDRFRGRVMIPIRSESGKVIAFGARLLDKGEPKYLNSSESVIYRKSYTLFDFDRAKDLIRKDGFAILMEGYLDCIQAQQAGIGNAVACCGTSLTAGHSRLIKRYTDRVVVNFDPDAAGQAATRRSIDLLIEEGFQVSVLTLPPGEDPDSFIRKRGPEAYREALGNAKLFIDYIMERTGERHDVGTPRGKATFLNDVLPTLALIPSHVERVAYVSRLAERAGISDEAVVEELRRKVLARSKEIRLPPESSKALKPAERDLVRWLLSSPPESKELLNDLDDEDLQGLVTAPILKAIRETSHAGNLSTEAVMQKLSADRDRNLLTQIALEPSPLGPRQSPRDCLNRLREQRWRRQLSLLQARLARGEEDDSIAQEILSLARRIDSLGQNGPEPRVVS